jgi:hypothetical protein
VDGNFIPSFGDIIDQVSVLVQKDYPAESAHSYNGTLLFSKSKIDSGKVIQSLAYQRLGDRTEQWLNYKYKVGWKFIGIDSIITTPLKDWTNASVPTVSLKPPLNRTDVEIGINKQLLQQEGIQSVRIRFASILFKKPFKGKTLVIRPNDANESLKTVVYHDENQPVVYQINWYTNKATVEDDLKVLDDDFLFLIPPKVK